MSLLRAASVSGLGIGSEGVLCGTRRIAAVIHEVGYILEEGVARQAAISSAVTPSRSCEHDGSVKSVVCRTSRGCVCITQARRTMALAVACTRLDGKAQGRHPDQRFGKLDLAAEALPPKSCVMTWCHSGGRGRGCRGILRDGCGASISTSLEASVPADGARVVDHVVDVGLLLEIVC